jgi:heterodisulfide reductase subunit B2
MTEREYIYYQGCAQEGTAREYDLSLKMVMKRLGATLREPDDWSCCGSTPAHTVDDVLAAALAARNLALVEKMGASMVTTPCPACLSALKLAHIRMAETEGFRDAVNSLIDEPYNGSVVSKSNLQVIYEDFGLDEIADKVTHSLPDLKVACYYGCIMTRPPEVAQFDDPENPVSMDKVLRAAGIEVTDFAFKLECCGAAFGVTKREMVNQLTAKILTMALDSGANCVAVACPLCQQNLDLRQEQVNKTTNSSFNIPILYFSQIMGLAFGYSPKDLGIEKLVVSPDNLIKNRVLAEKKPAETPSEKKGKGGKKAEVQGEAKEV